MRSYDFRQKEVINLNDFDAEIDVETCQIVALIIPGQGKVLGIFGKENELVIPWQSIAKIGDDIILIRHDVS